MVKQLFNSLCGKNTANCQQMFTSLSYVTQKEDLEPILRQFWCKKARCRPVWFLYELFMIFGSTFWLVYVGGTIL